MSNTPKPSNQELFDDLAAALNRSRVAQHVFGELEFPFRFHVHEIERGKYRVLEELPGQVVRYVEKEAVAVAILNFCRALPFDNPAFKHYRFDTRKAALARDYWMALESSRFRHEIAPVLQKSAPGWTFHRLQFDMAPGPTPLFDDFLAHIEGEAADSFLAFNGMLMDPKAPRQQYLHCSGPGGDGKGTWIEQLQRLYGNAYVSVTAGKYMENDKFLTSRFLNARVAAFPDSHNPKFVRSEIFMMLTGGDAVWVEHKGEKGFTAKLPTFFIISSNSDADISGSEAHRRRCIPVRFRKRTALNGDPGTYPDRLWEEMPHILHRCWEAWLRHKAKCGRVIPCGETLDSVVESGEALLEEIIRKHFVINLDIVGDITQGQLADYLRKEERFNDFQIHDMKKFLDRKGVRVVRKEDTARTRVMGGLLLKSEREEPLTVDKSTRF